MMTRLSAALLQPVELPEMPVALMDAVRDEADHAGLSVEQFVREIMQEHLLDARRARAVTPTAGVTKHPNTFFAPFKELFVAPVTVGGIA